MSVGVFKEGVCSEGVCRKGAEGVCIVTECTVGV
jgi:hypothetical protein